MKPCRRLLPLLLGSLGLACPGAVFALDPPPEPAQRSHRPLNGARGFGDAEELVAQRLRQARELYGVQDIAQRLLRDENFLRDLQQQVHLGNLTQEDLARLEEAKEKVFRGEKVDGDPALKRLLGRSGLERHLQGKDLELLRRWARQHESGDPLRASDPPPDNPDSSGPSGPSRQRPEGSRPYGSPEPSGQGPHASPWEQFQNKAASWVKDHVADWADALDERDDSARGGSLRDALKQFGRMKAEGNGGFDFKLHLAGKARGLSRYLPLDRLWSGDLDSALSKARLPKLPGLGRSFPTPSLPSASRRSGSGWQALLALAGFGALAVVLWRSLAWYRAQAATAAGPRELGGWPVTPGAVATRHELVRAFEYLALLRLGPDARTRHHLDLADQLGAGGEDDCARRQAAGHLARLYEQARYAPEDEPLAAEDLAAARRDLCFLAGVASA
jgi:hypothetical protein